MTQRNVELVIGRLLTDEEFRQTFTRDPEQTLCDLIDRGTHLSGSEVAALMAIDEKLWRRVADKIDPRLQKAALKMALAEGPQPVPEQHDD